MARSPSIEPPKPYPTASKRKGTRSVSTLTPSQLARKRANDREAQRAIRARTKEHIERLEHELEELRSIQGRDKTVQDLIRRNRALEDELRQLKESMGLPITTSPYSAPTAYDDSCGAVSSPRLSPLPSGRPEYVPDYGQANQQYVPMPNCEAWASTLPSSVPSPASSANTDEYGPASGYIPTSMPSAMMSTGTATMGVDGKNAKMEYDDVHRMMATQGYMQQAHHHHHQQQHQPHRPHQPHQPHEQHQQQSQHQQQHQPPPPQQQQQQQHHQQHQRPQNWNMYTGMYYDNIQNTACVTR